jgi:hypothetical protein
MVRDILKSNPFPNGFTTAQLYEIAVKQPPPADFPAFYHAVAGKKKKLLHEKPKHVDPTWSWADFSSPSHPEHPIRSIRCVSHFFFSQLFNIV